MTSRQRVLDAIGHRPPDRIPVDFWAGPEVYGQLQDALGLPDKEAILRRFGVDLRYFNGPALVGQDWHRVSPAAWIGVVFSACGAIVFCYLAWYYGVHKIGNAQTAVYSNLTPPVAISCAWLFRNSSVTRVVRKLTTGLRLMSCARSTEAPA